MTTPSPQQKISEVRKNLIASGVPFTEDEIQLAELVDEQIKRDPLTGENTKPTSPSSKEK